MNITVIDDYQDAFRKHANFTSLKDHQVTVYNDTEKNPEKLAARFNGAEVAVLTQQRSPFPRAVVEKLPPTLKLIAQTGKRVNHLDLAACTQKGILVAAKGEGAPYPTSELAWGLILSSLRNIPYEVQQLKQGKWQSTVGTGLHGKTLGVYAFGNIGSCTAAIGKAFGMKVTCWGRAGSQARARAAGYEVPASRAAFFADADVISIHLPLNQETRGIVTAADLACMKTTALFVNTSRAPLVQEGALAAALKTGRPGYAAVDVYEDEPVLNGDHPLLKLSNSLCTPHLGYVVHDVYERIYATVIDSILAYAAGKPVNVLNPEALTKK